MLLSSTFSANETYVVPEHERLDLPSNVEFRQLVTDIILCKRVIPWGSSLIKTAEELNIWYRSTQINSNGTRGYVSDNRSSDSAEITWKAKAVGKRLAPFQLGLRNAFHSCAIAYTSYNAHCMITNDTGYELLRYKVGQQFGEHIDAISGHHEGARQLSAIAYLNDDFTGGQIEFPRQNLRVKPESGDILLFPSNFVFPHTSTPIVSGTKYCVVTWFCANQAKG